MHPKLQFNLRKTVENDFKRPLSPSLPCKILFITIKNNLNLMIYINKKKEEILFSFKNIQLIPKVKMYFHLCQVYAQMFVGYNYFLFSR